MMNSSRSMPKWAVSPHLDDAGTSTGGDARFASEGRLTHRGADRIPDDPGKPLSLAWLWVMPSAPLSRGNAVDLNGASE